MSRYTTGLDAIDDISMLLTYLYMDENAYVTFENSIGVKFKLTIDKDLELTRTMINGASRPVSMDGNDITPSVLLTIVEQIKEQPAEQFPNRFTNRWEEIKTMTLSNITLTKMSRKR